MLIESPPAASVQTSSRYRELDALRGLAALAVVFFHYTVRYFELFPGHPPEWQFPLGGLGVQLFFGISGFVILMTLERSKTAADFVLSRFSRLYPAYWVCLAITFAIMSVWPLPGRVVTSLQALANVTMWQELWGTPHVDGVYWSLQVELIFYAMALLVFALGWLPRVSFLLAAWLTLALVAGAGAQWAHRPVPFLLQRFGLFEYSAFFAIGASAYLAWRDKCLSLMNVLHFGLAVIVASLYQGLKGGVMAAAMVMLFSLLARRRAGWLDMSILVYLGTISYPLYLLHQNIGYVLMTRALEHGVPVAVAIAVAVAVAIGLASIVTLGIERPALSWIRSKRRARALSQSASAI